MKEKHLDLWERNLEHPFLKEIESGDLPIENFKYYLKQDYLYLLEYVKATALLIAKSELEEKIRDYTEVLYKTVNLEIDHHKKYCEKVGIEELETTEMAPTTAAYTQYLVKIAYSESVPEIISVILPCFWVYLDMGKDLDSSDTKEEYREWILIYRSEEFEGLIKKLKADLDSYLENMNGEDIKKIDEIFKRSLRYEYMFWEMSYEMEEWDI
ncbi:MAG: thiaminase II [Candidatus Natronoplasma sp.]